MADRPNDLGFRLRRFGVRMMERARRTDALALLPSLEQSQWLSPEAQAERQLVSLRAHLRFCGEHVPFYAEMFAEHDFAPDRFTCVADLSRLPLLDKAAIIDAGSRLYPVDNVQRQLRAKSTSGSTGIPLNYLLDRPSHSYLWAQIWRAWGQAGYRPGDVYATLSGGALLPRKVDLKQRIYLLLSGCVHLPSYHLTASEMDRYMAILRKREVRYLYGYPSSLEMFATHVIERQVRLPAMAAVFTTSEMLMPAARSIIEEAFRTRVYDTYGCNDGGVYAFECAQHDGYHVGDESCFVEVVDDDGNPVADGEVGRIVTTPLINRGHPFLRYVTGDIGALDHQACACGRGLARLVQLQGRERDFVVTPDGRRVHGAFFNHFEPFYDSPWLTRFQIHQAQRDQLTVRVQVTRPPTPAEQARLVNELRRGLGEMKINIEQVDRFELGSNGKFRVVISDLAMKHADAPASIHDNKKII